jgi:hypothetical protein
VPNQKSQHVLHRTHAALQLFPQLPGGVKLGRWYLTKGVFEDGDWSEGGPKLAANSQTHRFTALPGLLIHLLLLAHQKSAFEMPTTCKHFWLATGPAIRHHSSKLTTKDWIVRLKPINLSQPGCFK